MASQIQALKDQEALISRTLDTILNNSASGEPTAFVFDTGGFIDLFKYHPNIIPDVLDGATCITTEAVSNELKLRKNYKIINQLYRLESRRCMLKSHIEVVNHITSPRDEQIFRYGMKRGSFKKNQRLGEADLSILSIAEYLKCGLFPVIISPDSDIPHVLCGIRTQMIGYLSPAKFILLYESLYKQTPRGEHQ